jgi:hypothetical protein
MVNVKNRERSFGISVGGVLCAIALLLAWRGRIGRAEVIGVVGVVLLVLGLLRPALLKYPSDAWWALAGVLAWVNTRVILSLAFFFVLTPIGLVWRLLGRDPMARRRTTMKGWRAYPARYRDPKHFERMF